MSVKHMLLACAFAPLAMGAAHAEDWKPTPNSVVPLAAPVEPDPTVAVDEKGPELNALRYYAHSRDLNRVAAEIRRIKLDYPNWNPPSDLYSDAKPKVDEQPLWDLYLKKDYAGIEAKMVEMKQANPDWTPTHDFTDKYLHAKAIAAIIAASDGKQWGDVVKVATSQDGLVNCNEIDLAWRIAEGFARNGDEGKATAIYSFLLNSCANEPARLGTAQKAAAILTDPAKVGEIIALGRKKPDGTNEFASIVEDRIRADLGEFASGASTTVVAPARVEALEKATAASKKSADALLLGWYYRKTKDLEKALYWTRTAYQEEANEKTAEAFALALRESYHFDEAERLSYEWREKGDQFRKMYIDIVSTSITAHGHDAEIMRRQSERETQAQSPVAKELTGSKGDVYGQALDKPMVYCGPNHPLTPAETERLARFKVEVEADKSAVGGQALGWRLYEANMPTDAAYWFEHSMVWAPNEPAAVGLAVTAKRFHKLDVYRALLAKYGATYPGLLALNGRQRSCTTAAMNPPSSGVASLWAPGRLFSSVPASTAAETPSAATTPVPVAASPLPPAADYPAPVANATAAYTTADANALLAPSDVGLTEQRAAAETTAPARYFKPRPRPHHYVVRPSAEPAPAAMDARPEERGLLWSFSPPSQPREQPRWLPLPAESE